MPVGSLDFTVPAICQAGCGFVQVTSVEYFACFERLMLSTVQAGWERVCVMIAGEHCGCHKGAAGVPRVWLWMLLHAKHGLLRESVCGRAVNGVLPTVIRHVGLAQVNRSRLWRSCTVVPCMQVGF